LEGFGQDVALAPELHGSPPMAEGVLDFKEKGY
jgi:hypothetical protein